MKQLQSDYLWPVISLRRPPEVDDTVYDLVQPTIIQVTRIMRLQNTVPTSLVPGGAREVGRVRAVVDKTLAQVMQLAAANDVTALPAALRRLQTALEGMELSLQDGAKALAVLDSPKPKRQLMI